MSALHLPFPRDGSFDPEHIRILTNAFEEAWDALKSSGTTLTHGHADATREVLAKLIIEMAKLGERDQRRLRDAALAHLAEVNLRKANDFQTGDPSTLTRFSYKFGRFTQTSAGKD